MPLTFVGSIVVVSHSATDLVAMLNTQSAQHTLNRSLPFEDEGTALDTTNSRIAKAYSEQFQATMQEFVRRLSESVGRQVMSMCVLYF